LELRAQGSGLQVLDERYRVRRHCPCRPTKDEYNQQCFRITHSRRRPPTLAGCWLDWGTHTM